MGPGYKRGGGPVEGGQCEWVYKLKACEQHHSET